MPTDLNRLPRIDALVECSAEPSALAGSADGATDYPVRTNLLGAWHCLELARRDRAHVVFLSTSRVYPIKPLQQLAIERNAHPFQPQPRAAHPRRLRARHRRGLPAHRRPHPLRRHQARRRAADRGIPRGVRPPGHHQPLRRDRRPVADGQRRAGRLRPLGPRAPPARTPPLHRLRGPPGPRPAPHRRPGRPARRPARPPGALGRRHGERRGRSGELALAARGHDNRPARHRQRGPGRDRARTPGTATSRSTSPTAAASTPTRTGARRAAPSRRSPTSPPGLGS